jgi:surface antigen
MVLVIPFQVTAQPSTMMSSSPSPTVQLASGSFVELTKRPDYDADVLVPLHKAQAEAKAAKEAEEARLADEAAKAAEAARVAQEAARAVQVTQAAVSYYGGNNYSWGQCTWYVANRTSVPSSMGNATAWEYGLINAGWHYGLAPGAVGVSHEGYAGHVVYVEWVQGDAIGISEMNFGGGVGVVSTRVVNSSSFIFLLP